MRNRYVLVADLFAIGLCLLGAFVLRLDWFFTQSADLTRAFTYAVVAGVLAKPAVFHAAGSAYEGEVGFSTWGHEDLEDAWGWRSA